MKNILSFCLFLILSFLLSTSAQAQKLNLITQTKAKSSSPLQNQTLVTDVNGQVQWVATSTLGDSWGSQTASTSYGLTGNGASGTPLRVDTSATGLATQNDLVVATKPVNGLKKYTAPNAGIGWGGIFDQNTSVNGAGQFASTFDSLAGFSITVRTPAGSARTGFSMLPNSSGGGTFFSTNAAATLAANVAVKSASAEIYYNNIVVGTPGRRSASRFEDGKIRDFTTFFNGITAKQIRIDTVGIYLDSLDTKGGSDTQMLYYNPTTKEITKGAAPSGGSSITVYSAGNGALVTATGTGVTFTRTSASVWTFSIPSGVDLLSFGINSTAGESATAALDIDFVFAGTRPFNQNTSADMTDAHVPVLTTLKKVNPAQYPTTAAGNNASWTSTVPTAGTLRVSTTEFTEVGNGGGNATTVKGAF